jgi:hypothetical protein
LNGTIPEARDKLLRFAHGGGQVEGNPLQAALAACALLNFGVELSQEEVLGYILGTQESDGGWRSYPIYFDGRPIPQMTWGSRAVTTGFCIEALVRAVRPVATTGRAA